MILKMTMMLITIIMKQLVMVVDDNIDDTVDNYCRDKRANLQFGKTKP